MPRWDPSSVSSAGLAVVVRIGEKLISQRSNREKKWPLGAHLESNQGPMDLNVGANHSHPDIALLRDLHKGYHSVPAPTAPFGWRHGDLSLDHDAVLHQRRLTANRPVPRRYKEWWPFPFIHPRKMLLPQRATVRLSAGIDAPAPAYTHCPPQS